MIGRPWCVSPVGMQATHSATRSPTLDDTFPFMLPGWKAGKTLGGYTSGGGGGAARITVPREGVDIEMRNSRVSPVVGPQSVPSRVSVVLVEETEVRCAERLASVPVDKDVGLLAGVACPAGVTVCEDCVVMPDTVGTLSPSDSDSVGTLSPSDSVGPVGTLSPSDSDSVGHDGPDGTLSSSDPAVILFPAVPAGIPFPVGLVGHVGPDGMLSSSDLVGILFPAVHAGIPSPAGPDGTLSSSDPAGMLFPAVPAGMLFPAGPVGPVGPDGTLSSSDHAGILFSAVPAGRPFPPAEIPFPAGPVVPV